ncbi:RidA family protein [Rhizobium sullae]|uniref:RidA family protein n=1 Tax=Rhizobium sullae TaxID=50338 RepID=UPI000428CD32|nr:RidA family protein [Rhizobium sullae]
MEHVTKLVVYLTDVRTREAVDRAMIAAFETVARPAGGPNDRSDDGTGTQRW